MFQLETRAGNKIPAINTLIFEIDSHKQSVQDKQLKLPASESLSKNSRYGLAYIRVLIRSHNQRLDRYDRVN